MRAILFLIRKQIKNSLMELLHHPARLITNAAVIAVLVMSLLSGGKADRSGDYLDLRILHGGFMGVMLLIGLPSLLSGLKNGAAFFQMSDVNFLFVSPISPKKILAYGLVKQMAATLLMMLFLLFYGATLSNLFGLAPWQTVALIGCVALLVFIMQIFALLIYSFTSGRPERANAVRAAIYALVAAAAAIVVVSFLSGGSDLEALLAAVSSPYLAWVPVFGWIKGLAFGIILSNRTEAVLYGGLTLLALAGGILLFVRSDADYYEDVLQAAETTFELKKSIREGRSFQKRSDKPIRVRETGINRGWGADTFFYKHLLQSKRKSRIPFVGTSSLVLVAVNLILAVFLQNIGASESDPIPTGVLMAGCLLASAYILFFFNIAGDWVMELAKPYIYLVPESSFSKLFWASLSSLIKPAADGLVIFTVLGVFVHANPFTTVLCILIYATTGFVFTAGNILSQRVLGTVGNKGLIMLAYMFMLALLFAPGVGVSALLYAFADFLPGFVIGLPIVVSNILVSLGIYAACRNVLSNAEMNNT
ncbi:MAG: hypothetical protein GX424_06610 [Clostridiales bacterium]|nr:hypothetical protein [Clostridiales bacterium]